MDSKQTKASAHIGMITNWLHIRTLTVTADHVNQSQDLRTLPPGKEKRGWLAKMGDILHNSEYGKSSRQECVMSQLVTVGGFGGSPIYLAMTRNGIVMVINILISRINDTAYYVVLVALWSEKFLSHLLLCVLAPVYTAALAVAVHH